MALQASPHVAGQVAYFLSLYPESFNVATGEFDEAAYYSQYAPSSIRQGAQIVLGKVQQWTGYASRFAPVPVKEITPKALKAALLKIATVGVLSVRSLAGHF